MAEGGCYFQSVARLTEKQMERISKALAEPRRFRILKDLARTATCEMSCTSINQAHDVSNATISHHLKELEGADLVDIKHQGKFAQVVLRRDVWDAYLKALSEI
jgi:DNA-binding transcriptional ArsR family regulator